MNEIIYQKRTVYADDQPNQVALSFLMSYSDWCELKSSRSWNRLVEVLEEYEKQGDEII